MNIKKESKDYDFEAHKELVAMQPGDVPVTYADSALERDFALILVRVWEIDYARLLYTQYLAFTTKYVWKCKFCK